MSTAIHRRLSARGSTSLMLASIRRPGAAQHQRNNANVGERCGNVHEILGCAGKPVHESQSRRRMLRRRFFRTEVGAAELVLRRLG
jgi:hypothetical protein